MTPDEFQQTDKLYHYTSLKNGLLILLSGKMIMSSPSKANDINESYRMIFCSGCEIEDAFAEVSRYQQSSFTMDNGRIPGFAISALWGHYADKGTGVCLVFDKAKLTSQLNDPSWRHGAVCYDENYDSSIKIEGNPQKYIEDNIPEVFFTKSSDWSYEREYRIIRRSDVKPVEIDIKHAVIAVIVHRFSDAPYGESQLSSTSYKILVNSLSNLHIPILFFGLSTMNGLYELTDFESNTDGTSWFPLQECRHTM